MLQTPDGAGYYFGEDVQLLLEHWAGDRLHRHVLAMRGDSPYELAAVILLDSPTNSWSNPLQNVLHYLGTPDDERYVGPGGLFRNVAGKLRYTLRTGRDSSHLENNPHLALPGDFPYAGAIRARGLVAAVSGLLPQHDVEVARGLINEVARIRGLLAQVHITNTKERKSGTPSAVKYMGADPANARGPANFAFVAA